MSRKPRERRLRPWYIIAFFGATAVLIWVLVPNPFVRGLVVGAVVGPGFLIAGLAMIARRLRGKLSDHLKPPPLPIARWDYEMVAEDLDGNRVEFGSFSGNVLILNFWGTRCGPCIAEMPSLAKLMEATSDLGVSLACVTQEPRELVRNFLEKRDIDVPVYVLDGKIPECFASRAIPATYILDKQGLIAFRHIGAAAWNDEGVVAFVRGLAVSPIR